MPPLPVLPGHIFLTEPYEHDCRLGAGGLALGSEGGAVYGDVDDSSAHSPLHGGDGISDPKFLEEVANMKEKNLAVELLKKLISERVPVYRRTNVVKSEKFSEIIQSSMNRYLNGMLTNEEVIQELLKLAKEIADADAKGESLGLTAEELAFYDALTKPQAINYSHIIENQVENDLRQQKS